jgi:hypothetical protein
VKGKRFKQTGLVNDGGMSLNVVREITYIEPGPESTAALFDAVVERMKKSDINSVVVASTKGKTALKLAEALKGSENVISVTEFTYDDDVKKRMKKLGVIAIERADLPIQDRRGMRDALTFFGDGVKAALEVASIVSEKEAAPPSKVIALAGGRGGLDTALVVRPAPPSDFSSPDPDRRMLVQEIIAMPLRE